MAEPISDGHPCRIGCVVGLACHVPKWGSADPSGTRDGFQPKDPDRARLIKAVRKHAALLLKLADAVEREGHERVAAQ